MPEPIPNTYSLQLRQVVNAMLVKDHNLRIPLNVLITAPQINERVRTLVNDLMLEQESIRLQRQQSVSVEESTLSAQAYLQLILNNIDTQPASTPIRGLIRGTSPTSHANIPIEPGQVDFETKNILVSRSFKSSDRSHLVRLEMLQDIDHLTVSIKPEIVAGDGIVRISLRFEDKLNQDRGFRWTGVVDANLDIPDSYYPGKDKDSAGYCGSNGKIYRNTQIEGDVIAAGNVIVGENDIVTMEVNMAVERSERTLHFFVNEIQQPISLFGLPDSVKFCVHRQLREQIVKIISLERVSNSQVVNDIPDAQAIQWKDEDELATELLRQQP
ncbi:MAG: hypothetical protein EZS28_030501 [Streblomastix strix]|uniref:Uncharacterized protein n=1 Tax=Streblomastix strix TaxID=222440 RepID=A0A5J4UVU3_9EUKA|nr:MAG: hypothetical protein EZS28_030501 [Streblomastix strix]